MTDLIRENRLTGLLDTASRSRLWRDRLPLAMAFVVWLALCLIGWGVVGSLFLLV